MGVLLFTRRKKDIPLVKSVKHLHNHKTKNIPLIKICDIFSLSRMANDYKDKCIADLHLHL